jgi:hypothetical protein
VECSNLNSSELIVHGVTCGTIQDIAPAAPTDGDLRPILKLWEDIASSSAESRDSKTWKEHFVTILQGRETAEKRPGHNFPRERDCQEAYATETSVPLVSSLVRGRSYFRSAEGHLGLCPPSALPSECFPACGIGIPLAKRSLQMTSLLLFLYVHIL